MTNLALNPFKKGKKTEVEGVRKVEVETDFLLQKVLEQYNSIEEGTHYSKAQNYIYDLEEIVLHPKKIDQFLQNLIAADLIKGSEYYDSDIAGDYITKLIQNSYKSGNNNFVLHTQNNLINNMGLGLIGEEENHINVTLYGNVGSFLGRDSEYSNFTINGNTGCDCGFKSKYSNFTIRGDTLFHCGSRSEYSNFTINGNTGFDLGFQSEYSNFTIYGDIGDGCARFSEHSLYKTPKKETYEKMFKYVPKPNTIQLLGPNGEVLKEVEK